MARGTQAVRVLKLRREFEGQLYITDLEALAERHGITSRTLRRDLQCLEEAYEYVPRYRTNPE